MSHSDCEIPAFVATIVAGWASGQSLRPAKESLYGSVG